MHLKKFNKKSINGILGHFSREWEELHIDKSRTAQNYHFGANKEIAYQKIATAVKVAEKANRKLRDNTVIMASWIITAPKDLDKSQEKEFFEKSYNFLANRYGLENALGGFVHLDEQTPHMHFSFMPIDSNLNFNAKKIINRTDLKSIHQDLQKELQAHQINCTLVNNITMRDKKQNNKSIETLKKSNSDIAEITDFINKELKKDRLLDMNKNTVKLDLVQAQKILNVLEYAEAVPKSVLNQAEARKKEIEKLIKEQEEVLRETEYTRNTIAWKLNDIEKKRK